MIAPLKGVITSPYGERLDPFDNSESAFHKGVDIGVPVGTKAVAIGDGAVTETGSSPTLGNYIKYRLTDGRVVLYAHLQKTLKQKGDRVTQGEVVALTGNTGASTGAHLHFAVYENGKSVNPQELVKSLSN